MKSNWKVKYCTFSEEVIEEQAFLDMTKEDAYKLAESRAKEISECKLLDITEESGVWIRSKIALVLGINNQYAGMCMVDNPSDLNKIKEKYDFPYIIEVVDDIPSLEEFLKYKKE
jgi:hypothetical protein